VSSLSLARATAGTLGFSKCAKRTGHNNPLQPPPLVLILTHRSKQTTKRKSPCTRQGMRKSKRPAQPARPRTPINLGNPSHKTKSPHRALENDMSNPDWTEAPDQATHWDEIADVFCNVNGWWHKNQYVPVENKQWGTDRYTPRPSCQTDRTQLIKTLNQLRGETDLGVVADVILSIGFRLER